MENNKKELLERVLLLMNYNNKETLSENISKVKVLTEQPDPNRVPKNQSDKDAIKNCKMQPRNYNWFAPKNKESVDKFCNSLEMNYPSFYSKVPTYDNPNPQTTQQTTQQKKKYTSEELKKYSIEQLINLYGKEAEGTSKVSFGTNKDNIIKAFAEKVSQMDYNGLVKLVKNNRIFRDSLYYSDSPSGTIQQPRNKDSFKGNVGFWGPLVVLVDYEIFERKLGEYNKNPKNSNYQPPIEPNWKDLIDKFKLSSLKQYQYSPVQYLTKLKQEEQGLKGYTEKGYPEYGNKILDIQYALVQLGLMTDKDVVKPPYTWGKTYKWHKVLADYINSGNYNFGYEMGFDETNPNKESDVNSIIKSLVNKSGSGTWSVGSEDVTGYNQISDLMLSWLRANAYSNIPPDDVLSEKGDTQKDKKEKFEKGVKDSKFLKISIYDVGGKVIPIYSRGDDPDLPTYSLESEGFELPPQTINLGPVFSILTDEQVKTLVDWLSEWCTEPVEVNGVKYGRKIVTEGGRGLNFDNDLFSSFPDFIKQTLENESLYPNCVVDFANKETNGDVGKWMIKFLKLPEDQIDLLLQFYPEDYNLIQTYLPGAPGSKDFYLNSPLVKNAVKMHISKNPGSQLGVMSSLYAGTTDTGDYPIDKITDSMIESTIKKLLKDCPGINKELKAIAGGQREYKGYIVGQYYSSLPGYVNYTIPCPDEWWDENGWKITMGGVLLASMVFPPAFLALGVELELAIIAKMSVDVGLNVYSAYRNKLAGNEEMAKIDLASAMLSFIVDTPGFEKKFLSGYGDFAELDVFNKLKKANPNTGAKMRNFVTSLSKVERRHLYDIINTPRFMRQVQVYGKDILDKWLKNQFGSQWKNIVVKMFREIGIKMPIQFSPVMLNMGYKIFIFANQVSQNIFKVPLDETKWKAFEFELKKRGIDTPEEADKFYQEMKNNVDLATKFLVETAPKVWGDETKEIKKSFNKNELIKTTNEVDSLIRVLEGNVLLMDNK
jgi:hypothetical protein